MQYMKVVYPAASASFFPTNDAGFCSGKTFSHAFGTQASPLELFLLKRDLMGPCWYCRSDSCLLLVCVSSDVFYRLASSHFQDPNQGRSARHISCELVQTRVRGGQSQEHRAHPRVTGSPSAYLEVDALAVWQQANDPCLGSILTRHALFPCQCVVAFAQDGAELQESQSRSGHGQVRTPSSLPCIVVAACC